MREPTTNFRQRAEEVSTFIQRELWDPKANRYRPGVPMDPKALPWDFMWANGVQFSALVGGCRVNPARYRPLMDAFFEGLNGYWDSRAPIPAYDAYLSHPGGSDKYYDDNAWMVLTVAEAYELTKDAKYLDRAEPALRYCLSGWDDKLGGGIYWREDHKSKNTCSNGPTAAAALSVARFRGKKEYVDWAERIVKWTNANLQAPNGLYWDNINLNGKVEKTQWTYNTALMLRAQLGLYRATKTAAYLSEAKRIADAAAREFVNPHTGTFRDDALFSHLLVEAFLDLYRETHDPKLLDAARRAGDFCYTVLRDPKDGGYWTKWEIVPDRHEPRKVLIANASVARLYWLLAATG